MERLELDDFRALSKFLQDLYVFRDLDTLTGYVLSALPTVISSIVVWLPALRPREITFAVHRAEPDFSERDRLLLNFLRPHLIQAYRNAEAVTLLTRTGETGGQALLFLEVLRVASLVLVDVATGDAGPELPVPVVLNDHEAAAPRALLWRAAHEHVRPPSGIARIRHPAGRADPVAAGRGYADIDRADRLLLAAALSPDGKRAATGGHNGVVQLWSVETGEALPLRIKHHQAVDIVLFSPDGRRLLTTGSRDRTIRFWNAETGALISSSQGQDSAAFAVAFALPATRAGADTEISHVDTPRRNKRGLTVAAVAGTYVALGGIEYWSRFGKTGMPSGWKPQGSASAGRPK